MDKEKGIVDFKEQLMKNFEQVKKTSLNYLVERNFIKEENEINIKNVIRYNKDVELTRKDSEQQEKNKFKLYVVEWEDTNQQLESKNSLKELEFLVEEDENGNIVNIHTIEELMQEYEKESFKNIKDVVDKTKENEAKPEEEQDKELRSDSLEEVEENEKGEEEKKEDEKEESKNDLTGTEPKYVMQTIDVDQAYIDEWTTFRKGFGLPEGVEQIAIANPTQKDENILSDTMTIYMLDNRGKIIENINGKTIRDYFEIDDSTGYNPMNDDNTKLELEGYAERNKSQTMRRFRSKKDVDIYLSIEQKDIGGYHEVYAGERTRDGNDVVEIQLETRNVEIQTDLDMQKIISGRKGIYNKEKIDKEADLHEEHGDDEKKIAIENADGDEKTSVVCDSPFVPDTQITWEQFSKSLGDRDLEDIGKEFFERYNGKNGEELVLRMQVEDKEKREEDMQKEEEREIEEDYEGRVPWDRSQH